MGHILDDIIAYIKLEFYYWRYQGRKDDATVQAAQPANTAIQTKPASATNLRRFPLFIVPALLCPSLVLLMTLCPGVENTLHGCTLGEPGFYNAKECLLYNVGAAVLWGLCPGLGIAAMFKILGATTRIVPPPAPVEPSKRPTEPPAE